MTRRRVLTISLAAVVIGLVAWLVWPDSGSGREDADWSAVPAVEPTLPSAPRDPDPVSVFGAWAQVDPCAVASALAPSTEPGDYLVLGPSDCNFSGGPASVRVETLAHYEDWELPPAGRRTAAGHAFWLIRSDSSCEALLPTSPSHALALDVSGTCGQASELARDVVRRLSADPHAFDRPGAPRPNACQLLATAMPPHYDKADGDHCSGGWAVVWIERRPSSPPPDARQLSVAGHPAQESRSAAELVGDMRCAVSWDLGRIRTLAADRYDDQAATVFAASCPEARKLARTLIPASGLEPAETPPLDPLFYRTDEPLPGGTGACRFMSDRDERACALHAERSVPEDPVEFLRHGEADPDVVCSAARDAVSEVAPRLRPVTARRGYTDADSRECVFVDPTGEIRLTLWASREPVGSEPNTTVAGHETVHSEEPIPTYQIALDTTDDRGSLTLRITAPAGGVPTVPEWFDGLAEELAEQLLG